MRVINFAILSATAGFLLAGCAAPPRADGPTRAVVHVGDRDAAIDAIMTVLREHDFPPAELDRHAASLVTQPSTGGQWFEIWRRDIHGGYQTVETSLHTVRRIVSVWLTPVDETATQPANGEGPAYELVVEVEKERFSSPERQVTTASGALAIYSERLPTTEGLRGAASRGDHWVPLGRDVLLEEYLLGKFEQVIPVATFDSLDQPSTAEEPATTASEAAKIGG